MDYQYTQYLFHEIFGLADWNTQATGGFWLAMARLMPSSAPVVNGDLQTNGPV
jgi:hypothetical protein